MEQQLADVDDIAALERLLDHALLDTMAVDFAVNLGRHTGQMEGARRMLRENILRILEVRFGLPPKRVDALARRLAAIDDISELKRLLDRALQDMTIVDFEARLARLGHLAAEAASN
ncbi:MAG TPA: hypothetical protein ENJ31_01665 [Anaerolineae bacterium]|nr:hypothetical protein [Anaerolineae bacterium]